jgi:hypothetical protein
MKFDPLDALKAQFYRNNASAPRFAIENRFYIAGTILFTGADKRIAHF